MFCHSWMRKIGLIFFSVDANTLMPFLIELFFIKSYKNVNDISRTKRLEYFQFECCTLETSYHCDVDIQTDLYYRFYFQNRSTFLSISEDFYCNTMFSTEHSGILMIIIIFAVTIPTVNFLNNWNIYFKFD